MSVLGHWRLDQFTLSFSDRRPSRSPFDDGFLFYGSNGTMQACLSKKIRSAFSQKGLERGHNGHEAEKSQCFDEYLSYAGRYQIQQNQVIHHVELSLNPTIIGTKLKRFYRLEGKQLILFYDDPQPSGLCCHYELIWSPAHAVLVS
ncbi:MAG: lipocalin-like domain-containing protein [Myxococcota bacterium]|nr:lipocalin-like domain-containing protein [Myxococcota bacterium]